MSELFGQKNGLRKYQGREHDLSFFQTTVFGRCAALTLVFLFCFFFFFFSEYSANYLYCNSSVSPLVF